MDSTSNAETFWQWITCRDTNFKRREKLIVFFHIHFVTLIKKRISNFKHLNFLAWLYLSGYIFGIWQKLVVFIPIHFLPLIERSVFLFKHWNFWHGSTSWNPFFKNWQLLIVILCFPIHLLPLVEKIVFSFKHWRFLARKFLSGYNFHKVKKIDCLFSHTFRSFDWGKCIQLQTLKLFGMEVFVGTHFLKSGKKIVFFHINFVPLFEKNMFNFKQWNCLSWNFCRDTFFTRWQKLIVIHFFHIHFHSLIEKSVFNFKRWKFLAMNYVSGYKNWSSSFTYISFLWLKKNYPI